MKVITLPPVIENGILYCEAHEDGNRENNILIQQQIHRVNASDMEMIIKRAYDSLGNKVATMIATSMSKEKP